MNSTYQLSAMGHQRTAGDTDRLKITCKHSVRCAFEPEPHSDICLTREPVFLMQICDAYFFMSTVSFILYIFFFRFLFFIFKKLFKHSFMYYYTILNAYLCYIFIYQQIVIYYYAILNSNIIFFILYFFLLTDLCYIEFYTFLILIKVFLPGHFPNKINLINRQDPIPTAL